MTVNLSLVVEVNVDKLSEELLKLHEGPFSEMLRNLPHRERQRELFGSWDTVVATQEQTNREAPNMQALSALCHPSRHAMFTGPSIERRTPLRLADWIDEMYPMCPVKEPTPPRPIPAPDWPRPKYVPAEMLNES